MTDMLVKLYRIRYDYGFIEKLEAEGISVYKPERDQIQPLLQWIEKLFSQESADQANLAFSSSPSCGFIAKDIKSGTLIGYACYDATGLGFFGPIGVLSEYRGKGISRALVLSCLFDMKMRGYGYAIIGNVGPTRFYEDIIKQVAVPDGNPNGSLDGAISLN
jgi:GNAT superfamily N-acetyltransferase